MAQRTSKQRINARKAQRDAERAASNLRRREMEAMTDLQLATIKGLGDMVKLLRAEIIALKSALGADIFRYSVQAKK